MPNLDESGPTGEGPTGLRRGGCTPTDSAPTRGRGFGRRWCPYFSEPQITLEEEEKLLKERIEEIEQAKKEK